jgi:hypothetical protein
VRSLKKLVGQIERYDEEFAGDEQPNAVKFGDVLVNDRLRVMFCDALAGETLASKARAHDVVYFRAPGESACEAWGFTPLAPGSPMGTWSRTPKGAEKPLAFHYWQAAEEVRIFGPLDPASPSKPTDSRAWECEETYKLVSVDEHSLKLDKGRLFFDEASCRASTDETARFAGCVAARASGVPVQGVVGAGAPAAPAAPAAAAGGPL